MSRVLSELLGKPESQLSSAIAKLEEISGYSSEDVRLISEVKQTLREKTKQLGLDPNDTSAAELYHGLLVRLSRDIEHLNRVFAGKTSGAKLSEYILSSFNQAPIHRRVWALKRTTAKSILRANPPKRLMKQLNYRSAESMLKRENPATIFAAAQGCESALWQKKFWQQLARVSPSDFEDRELELISIADKKWSAIAPKHTYITLVPQLGAAIVWPVNDSLVKTGLGLTLFNLQAAEMLRECSSYLKLHEFEPEFGSKAVSVSRKGHFSDVNIGDLSFSWQALQRHFSHQPVSSESSMLGPHIRADDLHWRPIADTAAELWPSLSWWSDNNHLAESGSGTPVPLNLMDMLSNLIGGVPLGKHSAHNFQRHLWDELSCRYLDHPAVEAYALQQLSGSGDADFNANVNTKAKQDMLELSQFLQAV